MIAFVRDRGAAVMLLSFAALRLFLFFRMASFREFVFCVGAHLDHDVYVVDVPASFFVEVPFLADEAALDVGAHDFAHVVAVYLPSRMLIGLLAASVAVAEAVPVKLSDL